MKYYCIVFAFFMLMLVLSGCNTSKEEPVSQAYVENVQITTQEPAHNTANEPVHFTTVSMGSSHAIAITDNGEVYTWGGNRLGELGLGDTIERKIPTKIPDLTDIVAVSLGDHSSAAIT